jgi:hypothetical protein
VHVLSVNITLDYDHSKILNGVVQKNKQQAVCKRIRVISCWVGSCSWGGGGGGEVYSKVNLAGFGCKKGHINKFFFLI